MKGFSWFIFADHQNEYIVSLRHYTFSRMNSLWLQQNLQILICPLKITVHTAYFSKV